jgi:hypothetical protein
MRRAVLLLLLLAAAPAARAADGVFLTLEGSYGLFGDKDALQQGLSSQVGAANASLLVDKELQDGFGSGLYLGYNVGGYAAIELGAGVHPWNLISGAGRGFVTFGGAAVRWFPLQGLVSPGRLYDLSLLVGVDYLLSDQAAPDSATPGRGLEGLAVQVGGTLELYPVRSVSIGLTPRYYSLHPIRYITDLGNRGAGGAIPLTGSVGGSFLSVAVSVTFHFTSAE